MKQHGKDTVIIINDVDISRNCNNSAMTRDVDIHDITGYGVDDYENQGGLRKGDCSVSGNYDTDAEMGPAAVLKPLTGQTVTLVRRPEGTGTGRPEESCLVVVGKYVETSPVAGMVTWAQDLTRTGAITDTTQA